MARTRSSILAEQQRRDKKPPIEDKLFKLFLQLAPVGYDAYRGYKDFQYAQIDDPETYSGVKGMYSFISNPTASGVSVANGIKKIQTNQEDSDLSFNESFKNLTSSLQPALNPASGEYSGKTYPKTKGGSSFDNIEFDLDGNEITNQSRDISKINNNYTGMPEDLRNKLGLGNSSSLVNNNTQAAQKPTQSAMLAALKAGGVDISNLIQTSYKPDIDDKLGVGANKKFKSDLINQSYSDKDIDDELDIKLNEGVENLEEPRYLEGDRKNYNITASDLSRLGISPAGNKDLSSLVQKNLLKRSIDSLNGVNSNKGFKLPDLNTPNLVPPKSTVLDKFRKKEEIENYKESQHLLSQPENIKEINGNLVDSRTGEIIEEVSNPEPDMDFRNIVNKNLLKNQIDSMNGVDANKGFNLPAKNKALDNSAWKEKLNNLMQNEVDPKNFKGTSLDPKPSLLNNFIDSNTKDLRNTKALNNSMQGIRDKNIDSSIIKNKLGFKDIMSGAGSATGKILDLGADISNISNVFKPEDKYDTALTKGVDIAKGIDSGLNVANTGKDVLSKLLTDKAKEAAELAAKKAAELAAKKLLEEGGKKVIKESTKNIPGLDIATNIESLTNEKNNFVQKIGSATDLGGKAVGASPTPAAPIGWLISLLGKGVNLAGSAAGPSKAVQKDIDRDKRIESDINRNDIMDMTKKKMAEEQKKRLAMLMQGRGY